MTGLSKWRWSSARAVRETGTSWPLRRAPDLALLAASCGGAWCCASWPIFLPDARLGASARARRAASHRWRSCPSALRMTASISAISLQQGIIIMTT